VDHLNASGVSKVSRRLGQDLASLAAAPRPVARASAPQSTERAR
jgi:hypothetical protein